MARISAFISQETQAQVSAYAKHLRIRKAALIEQALQYHLQALREIPSEMMIPPDWCWTAPLSNRWRIGWRGMSHPPTACEP
jgi:hypothetical protein